ncbi:hypothetical protein DFJ73DRAFT_301422 [Zopfochytrium polystomum]|nr:hypothetical protein DFJ73DRAFT_301422 [Zopfochytrium polystomum]
MTLFRPCIDLHDGQVKQIVGASLRDDPAGGASSSGSSSGISDGDDRAAAAALRTNFVSSESPAYYANLYRTHSLHGAHVIKLGPRNDDAAREALSAWPDGLQLGGGVTIDNAESWLDAGAKQVIVTSWLFPDAKFSDDRLRRLCERVGREKLVVDVSCKVKDGKWIVAMNKWQTLTDMQVEEESIRSLEDHCSELLVHAADVEGLCRGIDERLVERLGQWCKIPVTYAGGGKEIGDLSLVERLSGGSVDLTFGSALDIFGGSGVKFEDCVKWNASHSKV